MSGGFPGRREVNLNDHKRTAAVMGVALTPANDDLHAAFLPVVRGVDAQPHWTVLVVDHARPGRRDEERLQFVLSPSTAAALLGMLQAWHASLDVDVSTRAVSDQLDALRARAAAVWADDRLHNGDR
jgi:hypothetical protein